MSAQTVQNKLGYFSLFFQCKSFEAFEIVSEIIFVCRSTKHNNSVWEIRMITRFSWLVAGLS